MKTVSIHDAKTNLSKYIAAAKNGEQIYIGGFGKAEVLLTKIPAKDSAKMIKRNFAIAKGKVIEKPDSYSPSTEKEITKLMLNN